MHVQASIAEDKSGSTAEEAPASAAEALARKDFADCTEDEWQELAVLLSRLPDLLPRRRTRRYAPGRPGDISVRRMLRRAAATGGEPLVLPERRRRARVRPLIFLLDVSGSMGAYARGLLLFAHAVARSSPDTLVYTFGTELTDVSRVAAMPSFDSVLRAGGDVVPDWEGGTRIGEALEAFLAQKARQAATRRSVAFICSDGLDTGDPQLVAEQTERLQRAVHRVVWLNPLKADARYEPLARAMRGALPHVDVFESGHSLDALLVTLSHLRLHSRSTSGQAHLVGSSR